MWSSLPSNLRTVLGIALLLGLGVAAAAFTLSFFALRDAAQDPALAWGAGHAWLFPIGVDMALVFFEVLLLGATMVRVQEHGRVVQYPRAVPFLMLLVAAAGTLYFNAVHVPEQVRLLALAVPVASILVTLGLAYLLKMLTTASGTAAIHLAPPPPALGGAQTVVTRLPDGSYGVPGGYGAGTFPPSGAFGHLPGSAQPGNGHIGQRELDEASLRAAVEMYLSGLSPEQLGVATGSSIVAALSVQGIAIDERYARRVLEEYRHDHKPAGNGRRGRR
jgi:Protein of unknown function (DUF2637)